MRILHKWKYCTARLMLRRSMLLAQAGLYCAAARR
jgi:hypothetical protein